MLGAFPIGFFTVILVEVTNPLAVIECVILVDKSMNKIYFSEGDTVVTSFLEKLALRRDGNLRLAYSTNLSSTSLYISSLLVSSNSSLPKGSVFIVFVEVIGGFSSYSNSHFVGIEERKDPPLSKNFPTHFLPTPPASSIYIFLVDGGL